MSIVLANDADLSTGAGDPLELGLLRHATGHGINIEQLRKERPRVSDRPFDSDWKFTKVTVEERSGLVSYLKGAPEVVFDRCELSTEDRESWVEKAGAYAAEGVRVLALAWASGDTEQHLTLLGVVLFWDPPRPEVPDGQSAFCRRWCPDRVWTGGGVFASVLESPFAR